MCLAQGCSQQLFNGPYKNGGKKKLENSACAIDLEDGDAKLLDFRFADDLLLFARTKFETIFMLETLMEELAYVGLCLNAGQTVALTNETVALTNEAQPPQCLILTNQETIVVKGKDVGHKCGWAVFCQRGPMEGQFWTSLIIYRPPQGHSLPTNRFSVI